MLYETLKEVSGKGLPTSGLLQAGKFTSYPDVAERAGRIATGLVERGIEKGTPVGVLMVNGPDLLTLAYAIFAAGGVAVPLNALAPRAELAMTARKAHVKAVIASAPYAEAGANLIADLGGAGRFPLFVSGGTGRDAVTELERTPLGRLPVMGPDDAALYMFSSGSTGIPKVVPHTHGELDFDSRRGRERGNTLPTDIQINMMPGSHAMGFLSALYTATANATTFYWSDPQPFTFSKGRFAQAIDENKVTLLMGVPFMFDALAALKEEVSFSTLRKVQSGAIALREETFNNFKARYGKDIGQSYGSTECLAISINNDTTDPGWTWDSVGKPVDGLQLWIEPVENPFGPRYGEVVVSAPWVTKGYLDAPESNSSTIRDGKFYTGDLGGLGDNGHLYIKGRLKLLIEVAGHKVDPYEVEEVLLHHPAVGEVCVVGVKDPRTVGGQLLKAVVVRKEDVAADTLVRYCRERLSSEKVPGIVEFRDELPKSAAGKVLRGKLMETA
ncbi:MAG: class I adenylate-forming enzyme family protein [Devosia sp.]